MNFPCFFLSLLMWLLENLKYTRGLHLCLAFLALILFLLDGAVPERPSSILGG